MKLDEMTNLVDARQRYFMNHRTERNKEDWLEYLAKTAGIILTIKKTLARMPKNEVELLREYC